MSIDKKPQANSNDSASNQKEHLYKLNIVRTAIYTYSFIRSQKVEGR